MGRARGRELGTTDQTRTAPSGARPRGLVAVLAAMVVVAGVVAMGSPASAISPPDPPVNVNAVGGVNSITVTWNPAVSGGGGTPTDYVISTEKATDPINTPFKISIVPFVAGQASYSTTVTDLPAGNYRIVIWAHNNAPLPYNLSTPVVIGWVPTSTGKLRVVTSPAVPSQITIDGKIADTWGIEWVTLPIGSHTVCFSTVAGYSGGGCQTATVFNNAITQVTGSFTPRGYLKVNTSPPTDAQILVNGIARNNWGMWTDVPTGPHNVCFGAAAGATPPACQAVNVSAGATTEVTGTYTASGAAGPAGLGRLRVTTSPALPSQIIVDGQIADTWGLNWLGIAPGNHIVCFTRVEGWSEPPCQVVTVTAGNTTNLNAVFLQRGYLRIQTSPSVPGTILLDGVPVDDWGNYTDRPVGVYQVCFGEVPGKTRPACQAASVTAGNTTTITGVYT